MARHHRRWFAAFALPYLGDNPIEVGAGLGDYAEEWLHHAPRMTVAEADVGRLTALKRCFDGNPRVEVREIRLPTSETATYSSALAYNVLEHIEDDVEALRSMGQLVGSGGAVVIVVPAFSFAMSPIDVIAGHIHRYTCRSVAEALTSAGLLIEKLGYANCLGLICYLVAAKVFRVTLGRGPMVRFYDQIVVPATRFAERLIWPPFGESVVAVPRVGATTASASNRSIGDVG